MTDAAPLVSIVTPTRNQGQFIRQTIRSVRAQTYPEIEHIVVDGGSTDETLSILRASEGWPRFRWISEADTGMYDAAGKGFSLSQGEILAYLNSDDLYLPWSVEAAVEAITRGADLVFGDALLLDDATGTLRPHLQLPYRRDFLLSIGSFAQPATWWTRSLYERVGGLDRRLRTAGDLDFYLRATAAGRTTRLEEFLAVMRQHPAMQTVANADRIQRENADVRRRARAVSEGETGRRKWGGPSIKLERARAWVLRRIAWLRLVRSIRRPARRGEGWWRFRAMSRVRVDPRRVVLGQLPIVGSRFLMGAVDVDRRLWPAATDQSPPASGS
jgi:GT2 family glycosyltransferase